RMHPLLFLFALAAPAVSHAADADPFEPAGSLLNGTGTLQGESPFLRGDGLAFGLLSNLTQDLVVQGFSDGSEAPVLANTLATTLFGSYRAGERWRLDVRVPIYPYAHSPTRAFRGAAMGDLHVRGVVPFWSSPGDTLKAAMILGAGLPTGTRDPLL